MRIIAHTPVGKFEVDYGKMDSDFNEKSLTILNDVTKGKYSNLKLYSGEKHIFISKETLLNSVIEVIGD